MSCDSHRHYLVPSDMAMIERVLAHPDLRQSLNLGAALDCGAARFLIRKFQEGMTDEGDLTVALDRYLRILQAWRARPHCGDGSSHAKDRHCSGRYAPEAARPTGVRQKSAESPIMVMSDLLRAANELVRLTDFERARLLQRAAACIDDCHKQSVAPIPEPLIRMGATLLSTLRPWPAQSICSPPQR